MNNPLSRGFNVAVQTITRRIFPCGYDVSDNAPEDYDSLLSHHKKTGRVLVWSGASDQTIFACRETNYSFRAWHDSKHILRKLPFTQAGECAAMKAQQSDICALYDGPQADYYYVILDAEIMGQFHYNAARGGFPVDQMGFVSAYLLDQKRALSIDFGISIPGKG